MQERFEVVVGDITRADTNAIVNAANNELWMGSGVAGAIKRAGGEEIEDEAISKGPIEIGEAVSTGSGRLRHKRVIHTAAMGFREGHMVGASDESVRQATASALRVADEEGMTSIAFPALGTGVGGLNLAECADVMVTATVEHLTGAESNLERIVFVLRDEDSQRTFEDAIERHANS